MATLYKRKGATGTTWHLNWKENGQRRRESLGAITEQQAKQRLLEKKYELSTGQRVITSGLIFQNFAAEYLEWYVTAYPHSFFRTEQIINQNLMPHFRFNALDQIRIRNAEQYATTRIRAGAKRATVNKELRTLKALINKALDWEYVAYNPIHRLKYQKELDSKPPTFYSAAELARLYQHSNRAHWWRFLANTGLRVSEAQQLKRRWIGRDGLKIISTEAERSKSGKWREVPLFEGARESLDHFAQDGEHLYPRIARASFSRAAKKDIRRAGLEGSAHSLRHTFISHLVMDGLPLRAVQIYAGHSTIRMTEKYAHLAPDFAANNINLNL